jgi:hypothetical protein
MPRQVKKYMLEKDVYTILQKHQLAIEQRTSYIMKHAQ